jgi:hypothetical protein
MRPSSSVIATPNCVVSSTRLVARVAIAPRSTFASCAARIALRSMPVSASPEMIRKESVSERKSRTLPTPPAVPRGSGSSL